MAICLVAVAVHHALGLGAACFFHTAHWLRNSTRYVHLSPHATNLSAPCSSRTCACSIYCNTKQKVIHALLSRHVNDHPFSFTTLMIPDITLSRPSQPTKSSTITRTKGAMVTKLLLLKFNSQVTYFSDAQMYRAFTSQDIHRATEADAPPSLRLFVILTLHIEESVRHLSRSKESWMPRTVSANRNKKEMQKRCHVLPLELSAVLDAVGGVAAVFDAAADRSVGLGEVAECHKLPSGKSTSLPRIDFS